MTPLKSFEPSPEEKRALVVMRCVAMTVIILTPVMLPLSAAIIVVALTVWWITRY